MTLLVRGGPPRRLMLALRDAFGLDRFLETGTYRGTTVAWAAGHFRQVVTIEASEALHRDAAARHRDLGNVRFVLGSTRSVLAGEASRLGGPAVVWLDSHWSGGATFGESDECPLLFEIETLRASGHRHHLFIDDARLFLAPPPRPHKLSHWPRLTQVVGALTSGERPYEVLVVEDVIVAVPQEAMEIVWPRARDLATARPGASEGSAVVERVSAAARGARRRAERIVRRVRPTGGPQAPR